MPRLRAEPELRDGVVGVRPRRVGPHDRRGRRDEQQHAPDGLQTQNFSETLGFGPRPTGEQPAWWRSGWIGHQCAPRAADIDADQTSRHTTTERNTGSAVAPVTAMLRRATSPPA